MAAKATDTAKVDPTPDHDDRRAPRAPVEQFKFVKDAKLHFGRLHEAGKARNIWFADIPAGIPPETMLDPTYWGHYTRERLRPMDLIEAFCEDGSWEGLYRIMFVGRQEVRMSPIYVVRHDTIDPASFDDEDYDIVWKFGAKWAVVRKDDGTVIKDRLYPKEQAAAFLRDHLRRIKT